MSSIGTGGQQRALRCARQSWLSRVTRSELGVGATATDFVRACDFKPGDGLVARSLGDVGRCAPVFTTARGCPAVPGVVVDAAACCALFPDAAAVVGTGAEAIVLDDAWAIGGGALSAIAAITVQAAPRTFGGVDSPTHASARAAVEGVAGGVLAIAVGRASRAAVAFAAAGSTRARRSAAGSAALRGSGSAAVVVAPAHGVVASRASRLAAPGARAAAARRGGSARASTAAAACWRFSATGGGSPGTVSGCTAARAAILRGGVAPRACIAIPAAGTGGARASCLAAPGGRGPAPRRHCGTRAPGARGAAQGARLHAQLAAAFEPRIANASLGTSAALGSHGAFGLARAFAFVIPTRDGGQSRQHRHPNESNIPHQAGKYPSWGRGAQASAFRPLASSLRASWFESCEVPA